MRVAVVGAGLRRPRRGRRARWPPVSTSSCSRRATASAAGSGRASSRTAPSSRWAPSSSCPATTRSVASSSASGSASGTRACSTATASRAAASASTRGALQDARRRDRRGALPTAAPGRLRGGPARLASPLDPGAREAIRARLEVSCAATADRVEAAALAGLAAHSRRRLPERRGRQPADRARARARSSAATSTSSSPVERIAWSDDAARRLAAGGSELEADRVVLAVPAERDRPDRLRPAAARSRSAPPTPPSSTATPRSSSCRSPPPPPPSAVLSVPERYWSWTATGADGVQPVVNAFAGLGAGARAASRRGRAREPWARSLARLRPDLALVARRRGALDLGRRSVGRRRVLVRGAAVRGVGAGRAVPRLRRAHARRAPRADGRRARERAACRTRDPRRPATLPAQFLTVRSNTPGGRP